MFFSLNKINQLQNWPWSGNQDGSCIIGSHPQRNQICKQVWESNQVFQRNPLELDRSLPSWKHLLVPHKLRDRWSIHGSKTPWATLRTRCPMPGTLTLHAGRKEVPKGVSPKHVSRSGSFYIIFQLKLHSSNYLQLDLHGSLG